MDFNMGGFNMGGFNMGGLQEFKNSKILQDNRNFVFEQFCVQLRNAPGNVSAKSTQSAFFLLHSRILSQLTVFARQS